MLLLAGREEEMKAPKLKDACHSSMTQQVGWSGWQQQCRWGTSTWTGEKGEVREVRRIRRGK